MTENKNSRLFNDQFSLNTINRFLVYVPNLGGSVVCPCTSSTVSLYAPPLLTPVASQSIASDTAYLSAIQPILNDDTQTITTTASTIISEGDEIRLTSLNFITLSADIGCNITTPLVSLSQDLQVASRIQCGQIQCTQIQTDQLSVSSLSLPSATLSTFSDPATSSILIQINGSWWKIPIVPA